jgi:hypothetical protein
MILENKLGLTNKLSWQKQKKNSASKKRGNYTIQEK